MGIVKQSFLPVKNQWARSNEQKVGSNKQKLTFFAFACSIKSFAIAFLVAVVFFFFSCCFTSLFLDELAKVFRVIFGNCCCRHR